MLLGILCALGAGLMWGLVFVVPLMLADYPGMVLSFGRYIGFGLIALIPAFFDRANIAALTRQNWIAALKLSAVGNLLYYGALATAIQLADTPLPAMLIGTLPVMIAVFSNWLAGHPSEAVAWKQLMPPLVIILLGLLLVNASELQHLDPQRSTSDYVAGCIVAIGAVAAWTWYPIMNARHMRAYPRIRSSTWATAQGLATLPLALGGYLVYGVVNAAANGSFDFPLGPRPSAFLGLMLVLGLCASWIGALLWNRACQRLPMSLAAQLIVFETLSALLYAFLWRGSVPPVQVLAGAVLLCIGVGFGLRAFRRVPLPAAAA